MITDVLQIFTEVSKESIEKKICEPSSRVEVTVTDMYFDIKGH